MLRTALGRAPGTYQRAGSSPTDRVDISLESAVGEAMAGSEGQQGRYTQC